MGVNFLKRSYLGIGIIVIILFILYLGYNSMVNLEEQTNNAWSQVENQLQRRADLIPNLVNTVKGYASHEQAAIKSVSDARAKLAGNQSIDNRIKNEEELSSALSRLLMIAENYPNLKADANFRQLQDELAGTENRIAVARKDYNDVVKQYNSKIRRFPNNLFAGIFGFEKKPYFEAQPSANKVPDVNF
ncbi:LemA family protein [Bacillota bacterium LX-D]|nr:LemA family protein [Bacillota bacterium LX-D]